MILKIVRTKFFADMISIKNLDLNKFMIYEKSFKNIINYYVAYVTLNIWTLYTEESNGNKYMRLAPTEESKDRLKKY